MSEHLRALRALARRATLTGRVTTLSEAGEVPPAPTSPAARLALMKEICEEQWALAGYDLDHGPRSTWVGRVIRGWGDGGDP